VFKQRYRMLSKRFVRPPIVKPPLKERVKKELKDWWRDRPTARDVLTGLLVVGLGGIGPRRGSFDDRRFDLVDEVATAADRWKRRPKR
jgi:hypothetical protein